MFAGTSGKYFQISVAPEKILYVPGTLNYSFYLISQIRKQNHQVYFFSVAILGHVSRYNHNNIGNIYYKYHLWKNSELGIAKSTLHVLTP